MVDAHLFKGGHTDQFGSDDVVDVVDSFQHTFAAVAFFVAVAQFQSLMLAGGCAGGYGSPAGEARLQNHINFHSGVSS